jgi:ABC-type branched-subunit amino acid transport system ATPase component/V8-like Glu-specific endopeptidase
LTNAGGSTEPVLALRGIWKSAREGLGLRGIDVEIRRGEVVAFMGAAEYTKLLIEIMSGETRPDQGHVIFEGDDVTSLRPRKRARLGLASFAGTAPRRTLLDWLLRRPATDSLHKALMAAQAHKPISRAEKQRRAQRILEQLGLESHAETRMRNASAGPRTGALLAVALVTEPRVIVLERVPRGKNLREIAETFGIGLAIAATGYDDVEMADRVCLLKSGIIIADGPPGVVLAPAPKESVRFVSSVAISSSLAAESPRNTGSPMTKPWFKDVPPDFSRQDTRTAEEIILRAYSNKKRLRMLAENVGLDLTAIDDEQEARIFNRDIIKLAASSNRLLRLVAEVLHDGALEAYAHQLAALVTGYEAELNAALLDHRPSLSLLADVPPAAQLSVPGTKPVALAEGFERVLNAAAGFVEVAAFRHGFACAEARTARVLSGGHACGTGFLVGDRWLLTAWHVVAGKSNLVAQFDYKRSDAGTFIHDGRQVQFSSSWDAAHSEHAAIAEEHSASGPTGNALDYALIELAEPVGAQPIGTAQDGEPRGKLSLEAGRYTFEQPEPILIVGHPMTRPMQLSYAAPSGATCTASGIRVRYQTNTEPGSSGSPVFNRDWRLVALHHASGPTKTPGLLDVPGGEFNQGIPIALIIEDLKTRLKDRPGALTELGI